MANLFNVVIKSKSYIAGAGLLALALSQLLTVGAHCLDQTLTLQTCWQALGDAWAGLTDAFIGLGIIGLRHGQVKAQIATEKMVTAAVAE